ncbi:MAG: ribulose-phosphate 3-epimerase [Candidatus Woesearchaeota archaeon]
MNEKNNSNLKYKIAPSILSADFGNLNKEIKKIEKYSDLLHIDVMDGHFVPNISFGYEVVKWIKSKLKLDIHFMIKEPLKYAVDFKKYCPNIEMISFHASLFNENNTKKEIKNLKNAINEIKKLNVKVGLVLNPDKKIDTIKNVLNEIDYVLIMSVYAGFSGQKFIPDVLKKIKTLREKYNFKKDIEIDGGINKETIKLAKESGANIFVIGSAIFDYKKKTDVKKNILEIKKIINNKII